QSQRHCRTVTVTSGGRDRIGEVMSGESFYSHNSLTLHFGKERRGGSPANPVAERDSADLGSGSSQSESDRDRRFRPATADQVCVPLISSRAALAGSFRFCCGGVLENEAGALGLSPFEDNLDIGFGEPRLAVHQCINREWHSPVLNLVSDL